jgi:hypothetical protein
MDFRRHDAGPAGEGPYLLRDVPLMPGSRFA